jgi:hypothetical protein
MWVTARLLGFRVKTIRLDRTRRGWHVVIDLRANARNSRLARSIRNGFTPLQKVALQAVFGSDVRRETLNLMRVFNGNGGDKRWNILYSRKLR